MAARIKKGDKVVVVAGRDKGREGEVLKVLTADQRVVVQGVQMVRRHQKPGQGSTGGIVSKEAAVHLSNIAHVDPSDGKPTRVGFKTLENGTKVRFAKRSGEVIDR
jgi:large subunit ribosomal protein L24